MARRYCFQRLEIGRDRHAQREVDSWFPMAILDDGFVDRYFWKSPGEEKLRKARKAVFKGQRPYVEGRLFALTDFVIRHIYNLRCQLVHGAASRGRSDD